MRSVNGLVPQSFDVPERVETSDFILRKPFFSDASMDYEAVMANIDLIRKLRGGNWPTPDLTLEEDAIDLAWHQREFEMKRCFAYLVMDPTDKLMLGAVYLYPPNHPFNDAPGFDQPGADVIVNMWVTNDAYEKGLYPKLWNFAEIWLKTKWPFANPYFSNPVKP